jgi:hypothetical protein
VRSQAKSGDPRLKEEVALLGARSLTRGGPAAVGLRGTVAARARAADDEAARHRRERPGRRATSSSRRLLRELDETEAAGQEGLSALDSVLRRLLRGGRLITFFTAGDTETGRTCAAADGPGCRASIHTLSRAASSAAR